MSTAAQIRAAWASQVFSDGTITAITDKAIAREFTEESKAELSKLRYEQEYNFFSYPVIRRATNRLIGGSVTYEYEVEVNYYLEADAAGVNYTAVQDAFDAVDALVLSGLGNNWNSTVDFSELPDTGPEITSILIGDKQCWRGRKTYSAIKTV